MKNAGLPENTTGKISMFERKTMLNRKVTLIFVIERLGFIE
jgi:hypothetical protein